MQENLFAAAHTRHSSTFVNSMIKVDMASRMSVAGVDVKTLCFFSRPFNRLV
jgi:hypothetical protein